MCFVTAISLLANASLAFAQLPAFQQTLWTGLKDPVILNVAISEGNISIGYSREGQVTIYASGKDMSGKELPEIFFKKRLVIQQKENQIWVQDSRSIAADDALDFLYSINYRIEVPYRTEVYSTVTGSGNQRLIGVTGPATLKSGAGDIEAMQVRLAPLQASTGKGNISCTRVLQVNAETTEGNIILIEDGTSKAVVKSGRGKIEVAGARGSFEGSTDAGSLHIKAVLHGDWQLKSASGNIRVELPPKSSFAVDASTHSGLISIERGDMQQPEAELRELHQQVNGGGKRIEARSVKGSIVLE